MTHSEEKTQLLRNRVRGQIMNLNSEEFYSRSVIKKKKPVGMGVRWFQLGTKPSNGHT